MSTALKFVVLVVLIVVLFIVGIFAAQWVWGWVVPDVFSGAVEQHILPAALSFTQAAKVLTLLVVLGISGRSSSSK